MKTLSKYVIATSIIAASLSLFNGCDAQDEYTIVKGEGNKVYRTNKKTGETFLITGTTMKKIRDSNQASNKGTRPLSNEELRNLGGRGGVEYANDFKASIYNGNPDIDLATVVIELTHLDKEGNGYTRKYKANFATGDGKALTTSNVRFAFVRGDEPNSHSYSWNIIQAECYR